MKTPFLTLLAAAGLTALAWSQTTLPKLVGHRGASHAAPENTLASMSLAWKEGADGVEGDFHLTKDGKVVCMHDYDTLRTTGTKLVIKDSNWDELGKLDAGSWKSPKYKGEKIPLFSEMLEKLPAGKLFFVEIKSGPETIAPIKAILDAQQGRFDPKCIFIISFDAGAVAEARRLMPTYQAHLISSLKEYGDASQMAKLDATIATSGATGFQFKFRPDLAPDFIKSLKTRGLMTDSWVIDDPAQAVTLIKAGIEYITTDRPGPLRTELAQTPLHP